jgi:hypothetical protein
VAENASPTRKYKFSGHQTFVFRHGWLEKGVRAVQERHDAFSQEDALVRLGVGKNMVESIKHWCLVTQLLEEHEGKAGQGLSVSPIGKKLLLSWDPFLEDDASLWLVHWLLATNPRIGTTWQLMFGEFFRPDFTKRELVEYVASFAAKRSLRASESSILRDVDCFIRTYASADGAAKKVLAEESFDCPLQALNLIQLCPDGELYRFAIGPKPSLPSAIVAFAINEFFDRTRGDRNTLSIQECLYGPNSPGQVFKLDENTLIEYLEEIEGATRKGVMLDETAGLKQVYRRRPLDAFLLLDNYYGTEAKK